MCLLASSATAEEPAAKPAGESETPLKLKPIRVVIYDLQASGVDERMLGLVGESLLAEIRKLQKVAAMGMAEISALLSVEEQKQLLGCDDGACLAEVAGALGSDDPIVGSLGHPARDPVSGGGDSSHTARQVLLLPR